MNPEQALSLALSAAEAGAAEIMAGYGRKPEVRLKGIIDLVTEYDFRSEKVMRRIIAGACPDHAVLGEEEGWSGPEDAAYRWYLDPVDGTTNFAHGHPFFAVSIGLTVAEKDGERTLAGVVLAPALGQTFWAAAGLGGRRRLFRTGHGQVEYPLAVSEVETLDQAMLNTGFPYDLFDRGSEILSPFGRLSLTARSVRQGGAASLDLAFVAAGIADAYWEAGLKPWDVAAGLCLVREAGGQISDYLGRPYVLGQSPGIVGSNGRLHPRILEYLK